MKLIPRILFALLAFATALPTGTTIATAERFPTKGDMGRFYLNRWCSARDMEGDYLPGINAVLRGGSLEEGKHAADWYASYADEEANTYRAFTNTATHLAGPWTDLFRKYADEVHREALAFRQLADSGNEVVFAKRLLTIRREGVAPDSRLNNQIRVSLGLRTGSWCPSHR